MREDAQEMQGRCPSQETISEMTGAFLMATRTDGEVIEWEDE